MEGESFESLQKKYISLQSEKQELQKEFDLIKDNWSTQKTNYTKIIAELEKTSRGLYEKIKILEEKNVSTEERLIQFQKITGTEESKYKDLTSTLKKIQKNYILRKGMFEYKVEKIAEAVVGLKSEITEIKEKTIFPNFDQEMNLVKSKILKEREQVKMIFNEKFIEELEKKELKIKEVTGKLGDLEKAINKLLTEKEGIERELMENRKNADFQKEKFKDLEGKMTILMDEKNTIEQELSEIKKKSLENLEKYEEALNLKRIEFINEENQRKNAEKINNELKLLNEKNLGLLNSQKAQIENLESSVKTLENKLQKAINHINSHENESQTMKSEIENLQKEIESFKLRNEKQLNIINSQESELTALKNSFQELSTNKEDLETTIRNLKKLLEELVQKAENQQIIFVKKQKEFDDLEKEKNMLWEEKQIMIKDYETRIKALTDVIKSFEASEEEENKLKTKLAEFQKTIVELTKNKQDLTIENTSKTKELAELKEIFYLLQDSQQEELLRLISKSAENLLTFSMVKEQGKIENLNNLKILEKEIESYKPSIRSPKLDLILQQQRNLIEQIKETTQKCNVKEFNISPLEEIRQEIEKKLETKQMKLQEGEKELGKHEKPKIIENEEESKMKNFENKNESESEKEENNNNNQTKVKDEINFPNNEQEFSRSIQIPKKNFTYSQSEEKKSYSQKITEESIKSPWFDKDGKNEIEKIRILFEQNYIELLKNKKREIDCFMKIIEELEEDNSYLKEIINTKNFEIFYLKSESYNEKISLGLNIRKKFEKFRELKNYIMNIRMLTLKERDEFLTDFKVISQMVMEKMQKVKLDEKSKVMLVKLLTERSQYFEERSRNIENQMKEKINQVSNLFSKLQKLRSVIGIMKKSSTENNLNIFSKVLKLYKTFLSKENISFSDALKTFVFEEKVNNSDHLCFQVSISNLKNPLKREEVQGFVEIISLSLVRLVEISKILAKILKSFLLVNHKFPTKFNKIKSKYLTFINFIEEYNDKILLFHQQTEKGVLERFTEGIDLLSLFIKEMFEYRSKKTSIFFFSFNYYLEKLLKMGDQIKQNFEDLNLLRENAIFKEILLKDLERNQQLERLKYELATGSQLVQDEHEKIWKLDDEPRLENKLNKHLYQ